MQSLAPHLNTPYTPLGERRGKSDLAQFSVDLSWARAASDSARFRAYPSPPMSGSPPLPPRHQESSDRGRGSYGPGGQDIFGGNQGGQMEQSEHRGPVFRGYPGEQGTPQASYPPFRMEDVPPGSIAYQQPRPLSQPQQQMTPQITPQQRHHVYPQHSQVTPHPFPTSESSTSAGEAMGYNSPKQQRKTKGHVASACVPCKRAHLRCDAQRPCSRCLSNGKEDACVDVQHKKRGRPRLRDEREPRYDSVGPGYPHQASDTMMRRPLSMYSPGDSSVNTPFADALQRSGSYRILKSQGPGPAPISGPIPPRYIDHSIQADPSLYTGSMQPPSRMLPSQEPICAYLNMDMQIAKVSQNFGETVGLHSVISRKLKDIVVPGDHEKVMRLQRGFEDERREREPSYLPPIFPKFEEDRVIQAVGFGPEAIGQIRIDKQELFTFQAPDGQQRSFQARMGLSKKDSTYFIALVLIIPTQQSFQPPPIVSYPRESYPQESQYGYQNPQQGYGPGPARSTFGAPAGFPDGQMAPFRATGPLGSNAGAPVGSKPFSQPQQRQDYSSGQVPYQPPRSELSQQHSQRQRDLQLPPIRDQRGVEGHSADSARRRDDRSGRVDIGGLIEKPEAGRRGP